MLGWLPPGGRVFEIRSGDHRAVVSESGATLRSYDVGDRPVVEAFDGPETPVVGCQGELLAPWPNRVVDGRWTWRGTAYQLSLTEPDLGHALHGLVRTLPWRVVAHEGGRIDLETLLLAHPGWPFPMRLHAWYAVGPDGLTSALTATNAGRDDCPYGAAAHPYFAIPGGSVDDVVLDVRAATWLATDDRLAPAGRRSTDGSPFAFRAGEPVGTRVADTAYTDLERGPDGRVEATMTAPDGHTTVLWGDESVRWWQLYTGDTLPERWLRRTLALEPMTCAPDALNSGDDLVVLAPGEAHTMTWGIRLR